MYAQLVFLVIQICIPFSWYSSSTSLFTLYVLLAPVVYLMYFVRTRMRCKYDNEAENIELCRAVFLKLCVDAFVYLWITTSFNSLMVHIAYRYCIT